MNKSVRRGSGLSVIGLWLVGAVNTSYAQDGCLDARVTAFDAGVFQSFGYGVAVYGDTALIGAQWDNDLGTQSGSVYVYQFDPLLPDPWVFTQKLLASDGQGGDDFGRCIAMDGEVALIGALHLHDEGGRSPMARPMSSGMTGHGGLRSRSCSRRTAPSRTGSGTQSPSAAT